MDKLNFAHAITRLRVLETRLLDRIKLERLIDSQNAESAFKILLDNNYGDQAGAALRADDYEILLGDELKKLYKLMKEVSPEKRLVEMMCLRYDYHNVKVLLKAKALNKDLDNLLAPISTVPTQKLKEYISSENYRDLSPIMAKAILEVEAEFKKNEDPQDIDILLDKYMYLDIMDKANAIGDPFIKDFYIDTIDFINIKTFLRVKKQNKDRFFLNKVLIQGGKLQSSLFTSLINEHVETLAAKLSHTDYHELFKRGIEDYERTMKINVLEKEMDNFLMEYIKKGKFVSFGIEPLMGYMIAKETEIRNVRIIMVGKVNNISPAVIRERMRDIYV